ncbi:hypothetical protein [Bradyrhizobium sp. CCBAU 65884]|uniref:hypothetical protein n=1 Tax=Bradyrhizobium sp. CCBAU 65884 TaxID=722477 RepID=UPI00230523E0|nr:hypothetical protein [Bradyrhizobium sp. CCBAU 65884]
MKSRLAVVRIDPGGEFGSFQRANAQEIYFSVISVLEGRANITVGSRVSYVEELGEDGLEAPRSHSSKHVRPCGPKHPLPSRLALLAILQMLKQRSYPSQLPTLGIDREGGHRQSSLLTVKEVDTKLGLENEKSSAGHGSLHRASRSCLCR